MSFLPYLNPMDWLVLVICRVRGGLPFFCLCWPNQAFIVHWPVRHVWVKQQLLEQQLLQSVHWKTRVITLLHGMHFIVNTTNLTRTVLARQLLNVFQQLMETSLRALEGKDVSSLWLMMLQLLNRMKLMITEVMIVLQHLNWMEYEV